MPGPDGNDDGIPTASHTTSAEDQANVARLHARLEETNNAPIPSSKDDEWKKIPSVEIAPGAHKYVLISAQTPTNPPQQRYFVVSKRGAQYHANCAEPFTYRLEEAGYHDIRVKGGGRINYSPSERKISIFGYSYGFGLANHSLTKKIIQEDERFVGYAIDWTNDGY